MQAVVERLDADGVDFEIIVIDDASTDRTAEIVGELAPADERIVYLRSPYPTASASPRAGLERFNGDAVAIMMADGSDDPNDLVAYHRLLQAGYDCAFGSRFMCGGSAEGYPKLVVNRLVNLGIRLLFGHGYDATTNALKA